MTPGPRHTCHLELEALYAGRRGADCAGCHAIDARANLARDAFDDAFTRGDMDAADRALDDLAAAPVTEDS